MHSWPELALHLITQKFCTRDVIVVGFIKRGREMVEDVVIAKEECLGAGAGDARTIATDVCDSLRALGVRKQFFDLE